MEINIVLFVVILLLLGGAIKGYKRGLVNEVSAFIGLVMALTAVVFAVGGVKAYQSGNMGKAIIAAICFVVVILIHKIIDFIMESLKLVSKLPVIGWINKLAGLIAGACESVLIIWIAFILITAFNIAGLRDYLIASMEDEPLLSFLFYNNYIAKLISQIPW